MIFDFEKFLIKGEEVRRLFAVEGHEFTLGVLQNLILMRRHGWKPKFEILISKSETNSNVRSRGEPGNLSDSAFRIPPVWIS